MSRSRVIWRLAALLLVGPTAAAQEILLEVQREGDAPEPEVFHTPDALDSPT